MTLNNDLAKTSGTSPPESTVRRAFHGSCGVTTRKLLRELEELGALGKIAAHLFRAQKASNGGKRYRGGFKSASGHRYKYRDLAYDKKAASLSTLCSLLEKDSAGLTWGWKLDAKQSAAEHVLYVELPTGQCSFHSKQRYGGPDFPGDWDKQRLSQKRIIAFCESLSDQCK